MLSLGSEMLPMCNINMLEVPHLVKSRKWLSPVKDLGLCSSLGYEDVSCLKVRQWLWEKPICTLHALTCFQTFSHLWPSILGAGLCRYPTSLHVISVWVSETQTYLRFCFGSLFVCKEHKSGDTSICGELIQVDYVCVHAKCGINLTFGYLQLYKTTCNFLVIIKMLKVFFRVVCTVCMPVYT